MGIEELACNWFPNIEIGIVNLRQTLTIFSVFAFVAQQSVTAQNEGAPFEFKMGSITNFRQINTGVEFEGGSFGIDLRDGVLNIIPGCQAFSYFPPNTPGCPPGATGFLTAGDIDGDGSEDPGTYLSVTDISPAVLIAPFKAQEVLLASAPPSALPRPLAGFTNLSRSLFFDIQTELIRQYDVTQYSFSRQYVSGQLGTFDREVVAGSYIYRFPSLSSKIIPTNLALNRFNMLDGYRKRNNQNVGFRFLNVKYDDGFAVLDPTVVNTIQWEGNTTSYVNQTLDILYLSIKPLHDPNDPLSDPDLTSPVIFPNFVNTPGTVRVLLPSPLQTEYLLAPNFLVPGQTGLLDLEFVIFRPTNNVSFDRSIVRFRMPVRVANNFVATNVPFGTKGYNSLTADTDGDGHMNFAEWVFNSKRNNASSTPQFDFESYDVFVPRTTSKKKSKVSAEASVATVIPTSDNWKFEIKKVLNAYPKLDYRMQYSADGVTWTTIGPADTNWVLTDTRESIKVTSATGSVNGGGFIRAHVVPWKKPKKTK